jgi:signal transduction histidine kinase
MEERAALLGGTLTVQSRPGYGTEVEALIPYHRSEPGINHGMQEVKDDHSSIVSG